MTSLVQQSLLHWLVLHTTYIARLPQLLPAVAWLVESLQQHRQALAVPPQLLAEQQQLNSYLQSVAWSEPGREPSEAAELAEEMQRIAACVMAQVPHDYACNNPGV